LVVAERDAMGRERMLRVRQEKGGKKELKTINGVAQKENTDFRGREKKKRTKTS